MGDYREYTNRSLRSADSIAYSLIAKRAYPGNSLLSFLLVEGESDKKLYEGFTELNKCQINVAGGKQRVIEILSILEQDHLPGVLAIVDSDFDVLEEKFYASLNLLHTDVHDTEMMMIKAPSLDKFLREYGSEEKITRFTEKFGSDIRSLLAERTLPIGYLRWVSLREDLSFDFQELDFSKFVDKETLTVDIQKLIGILQHKLRSNREIHKGCAFTINDIQIKIEQLKNNSYDHSHVCCGHDVVSILSIGLRKALGSHNTKMIEADLIETSLRLAFEQTYFEKTQLYKSIQQWENTNKPFAILKI